MPPTAPSNDKLEVSTELCRPATDCVSADMSTNHPPNLSRHIDGVSSDIRRPIHSIAMSDGIPAEMSTDTRSTYRPIFDRHDTRLTLDQHSTEYLSTCQPICRPIVSADIRSRGSYNRHDPFSFSPAPDFYM